MSMPHNVATFLRKVNQWVQTAQENGGGGRETANVGKKAPRVLFDDIEGDITVKRDFLRKQKALLKEIVRDYSFIGTKINVLYSALDLLNHTDKSSLLVSGTNSHDMG